MSTACKTQYSISLPFSTGNPCGVHLTGKSISFLRRCGSSTKRVVRVVNQAGRKEVSTVDLEEKVRFLYDDLPNVFGHRGIDQTAYDDHVKFRDPITKHDSIGGYLFNIAMLKALFSPVVTLHWVKQTGTYEITARWTMVMKFGLLPWKPDVVYTGTSVMDINPDTGKFCSHLDCWDSIKNNDYFSIEGVLDFVKQLSIHNRSELESRKYQILKRTADYEVRKYSPFIVVETKGENLSGSAAFSSVVGYIFGKNSATENIPMTTPVLIETTDPEASKVAAQIILPQQKDLHILPPPNEETVSLREVEGGVAAVLKFSGKPTEDVVLEKERELRASLLSDGLKPRMGCVLARYNDPGRTWTFIMRNEVLIWLEEFSMD